MRLTGLWWWIDRWRKSSAFLNMTLEEQGAYRNLLDAAALQGGALPNDDRILANASGDAIAWRRLKQTVMARFRLIDGAWRNETLDEVLAESVSRAERQKRYRHGKNGPTVQAIIARDGQVCGICAESIEVAAAEIDHIIPVALGGHVTDIRNLQLAHGRCNQKKGARSACRNERLAQFTTGVTNSVTSNVTREV